MTDTRQQDYQDCFVTYELLDSLSEGHPIIDGLLIETNIFTIVAKPGTGKSALCRHLAAQAVEKGYSVHYLDMDSSASQIKQHGKWLLDRGVKYAAPQVVPGRSIDDLMRGLVWYAEQDEVFNKHLFILDTAKKFMNLMDKSEIKDFNNMLRAIGATFIMASHANKHLSEKGDLVYEGTQDVESDVDQLHYLYAIKEEGKQIITAYKTTKHRDARIESKTFELDLGTLECRDVEYRDVRAEEQGKPAEIFLNKQQQDTVDTLWRLWRANNTTLVIPRAAFDGQLRCQGFKGKFTDKLKPLANKSLLEYTSQTVRVTPRLLTMARSLED